MKKTVILLITAIFSFFSRSYAQEILLDSAETMRCLDTLHSAWVKIQTLPYSKKEEHGTYWTFGKYTVGTAGKLSNQTLYSLNVDKDAHWDDGEFASVMTFYIRANNPHTQYFPLQIITFHYNHWNHKASVSWA